MTDDDVTTIKWLIEAIPYGRVATYGQIAAMAGLPRRARFVAKVLRESDESDMLPWYRVVRANGRIAPRLGANEQIERLQAENVDVSNGRVKLKIYQWRE